MGRSGGETQLPAVLTGEAHITSAGLTPVQEHDTPLLPSLHAGFAGTICRAEAPSIQRVTMNRCWREGVMQEGSGCGRMEEGPVGPGLGQ